LGEEARRTTRKRNAPRGEGIGQQEKKKIP